MKRPVRVVLLDGAKKEFEELNKIVGKQLSKGKKNSEEIQLLKSIKQKIELMKENPFFGDSIPKKLIPKEYDVPNLWRIKLSHYWRMLYTIRGDVLEILCLVIEIVNHKEYNKLFGYK